MRSLLVVVLLVALGCGGPRAGAPDAPEESARTSPFAGAGWREVLPAGATFLVGADVPRLLASPFVRDLLPAIRADAGEMRRTLESAAGECGLSLQGDVGEVVLASFGSANPNAVAVATGRFQGETVARCMRLLLALRGSELERIEIGGHPALRSSRRADNAWVATPNERLLVLTGTRGWLARTLDRATPRFAEQTSPLRDLLGELPEARVLWAAGLVPVDSEPARLAQGVGGAPMSAVFGYVELEGGLEAELGAVIESPEGASKIVEFLESYLETNQALLEAQGLAPYAAKLELAAEGRVVRVRISLDRGELDRLLASLAPAGTAR